MFAVVSLIILKSRYDPLSFSFAPKILGIRYLETISSGLLGTLEPTTTLGLVDYLIPNRVRREYWMTT